MHNSEHLGETEMDRKEKELKVIQPTRFGRAEHCKTPQPKSNETRDNNSYTSKSRK